MDGSQVIWTNHPVSGLGAVFISYVSLTLWLLRLTLFSGFIDLILFALFWCYTVCQVSCMCSKILAKSWFLPLLWLRVPSFPLIVSCFSRSPLWGGDCRLYCKCSYCLGPTRLLNQAFGPTSQRIWIQTNTVHFKVRVLVNLVPGKTKVNYNDTSWTIMLDGCSNQISGEKWLDWSLNCYTVCVGMYSLNV